MHAVSLLYVPADQPAMLAKSRGRGAGAVIVDLEDAVAVSAKDDARAAAAAFVADPPSGASAIVVRVNGDDRLGEDIGAVAHPNLAAITIAKAEHREQVEIADRILFSMEEAHGIPHGSVEIICLIETALGLNRAFDLATHGRVTRLGVGEADLGAELGIDPNGDDALWAPTRSRIVVDSAAAGIERPIAPVSTDFTDLDALRSSTTLLASMGFGARAAIHPAQIAVIEDAFRPDPAEVADARRLIEQYGDAMAAGAAVFTDDHGRMVDEAVVRNARRVVAIADGGSV